MPLGPGPRAASIMIREYPSLERELTMIQAVEVFLDRAVTGVPVLDDQGRLVGILSERDCLRAYAQALRFDTMAGAVADFMSTHLKTVPPDADITEVTERFMQLPYNNLPVVDDEGRLLGMIRRRDVLNAIHQLWES